MNPMNEQFKAALEDIEATLGREVSATEVRIIAMAFGHGAKYGINETSKNAQRAMYGTNIGDIA